MEGSFFVGPVFLLMRRDEIMVDIPHSVHGHVQTVVLVVVRNVASS